MRDHPQNLKIGIITAILSALFLSSMNVLTKILSVDLDPIVIAFWRNLFAFVILYVAFILTKKRHLMSTQHPRSHIIRGILGTIGFVLGIWMYSLVPITEGTVIGFTAPLFVVMLSYPLLKEKVGLYRSSATVIGLIGIIFAVGFDQSSVTLHGLLVGVGFALCNGLVLVILRQLGKTEHAMTTVFYFMGVGLAMTALYLPFAPKVVPNVSLLWCIPALVFVGIVSLFLKTESYRHAPASVITPIVYTMLLWSVLFDYLIWNHVASINIWIGAAIIITSNIIILWREHKISKTNTDPQG